ncbi:hypothetical protein Ancab_012878 [Ancistrocladus abbreviatus]
MIFRIYPRSPFQEFLPLFDLEIFKHASADRNICIALSLAGKVGSGDKEAAGLESESELVTTWLVGGDGALMAAETFCHCHNLRRGENELLLLIVGEAYPWTWSLDWLIVNDNDVLQRVVLRVDSSEAVAGPGGFSIGYGPDDRESCGLLGFFGSLCLGWVEVDFDAGRCGIPPVWTSVPRDSAADGCCCCCSTPSSAVVAIVEDGLVVRLALFVDLVVGKFLGRVRSPLN